MEIEESKSLKCGIIILIDIPSKIELSKFEQLFKFIS